MELLKRIKLIWSETTVEPVQCLFFLLIGLTMVPNQELYVNKACKVNLNFTEEVCDNIYSYPEQQLKTQQLVAGIQAYNGFLQNVPVVGFALFAGPLSDKYGRKPLLISVLLGYVFLSMVYLVNSYWFYELKVEYLLFEFVQDMTGGKIVFSLAIYSYLIDVTNETNRTKRMAVLDAMLGLGFGVGIPMGSILMNNLGYTGLYLITSSISIGAMLYVMFCVKESIGTENQGTNKGSEDDAKTEDVLTSKKGCFNYVIQLAVSSMKTIFKKRLNGSRPYLLMILSAFLLCGIVLSGWEVNGYLFYRFQYKLSAVQQGHIWTFFFAIEFFTQLTLVPFLTDTLKVRDTTLVLIACSTTAIGIMVEANASQEWVLWLLMLVYPFYHNMFTTSKSAISKLISPTEVGKVLSVLEISKALVALPAKPFFGFFYKHTVAIYPGLFLIVMFGLMLVSLVLFVIIHFGLTRREQIHGKGEKSEKNGSTKL